MKEIFIVKLMNREGPESLFVVSATNEIEATRTVQRALERVDMEALLVDMKVIVRGWDPNEFFIVRHSHHGPMLENIEEE